MTQKILSLSVLLLLILITVNETCAQSDFQIPDDLTYVLITSPAGHPRVIVQSGVGSFVMDYDEHWQLVGYVHTDGEKWANAVRFAQGRLILEADFEIAQHNEALVEYNEFLYDVRYKTSGRTIYLPLIWFG